MPFEIAFISKCLSRTKGTGSITSFGSPDLDLEQQFICFCYYTDLLCQMFFKPILSRCIFLQLNYCQNTLVKNERKCPKSKFILKARYCITYNLYSNTKFLLLIIHEIKYRLPSTIMHNFWL